MVVGQTSTGSPETSRGALMLDANGIAALALRIDRPIMLVGMMGVGKSTVGRRLATLLHAGFADVDEEIESAAQMGIPEIFETFGEPYFRDGERRVIARLLGREAAAAPGAARIVIATGGGAFCNDETRALILERAIAVWLDSDLATLVARVSRRSDRPLLQNRDPAQVLAKLRDEREAAYSQAPIRVESSAGSHQQTALRILTAIDAWL